MRKSNVFYYDTRQITPRLILDLSTFCIASAFYDMTISRFTE